MSDASSVSVDVGLAAAHHLAPPDHGDPVRDGADLAQLVGDEDDRGARVLELAHDRDQLVGLLRREHGRRLVEDEDLGVPGQRLDDLDALLHAHRQVLDVPRRGRRGSRTGRRSPRTRERAASGRSISPPAAYGSWPRTTFSATVNTGMSMKCWWTMPMPAAIASPGPANVLAPRRRGPPRPRRPCRARTGRSSASTCRRRSHRAAQWISPGFHREIDVVVRDQRAEALRDAAQLELHVAILGRFGGDLARRTRRRGPLCASPRRRLVSALPGHFARYDSTSTSPPMIFSWRASTSATSAGVDLVLEVVQRGDADAAVLQRADVRLGVELRRHPRP